MKIFDTHKHFKELVATGFTEEQAEAIINLILASRSIDFENK